MPTTPIIPCIWIDGSTETIANYYIETFANCGKGRIVASSEYPAGVDTPSGIPAGKPLAASFEVAGQPFTLLNGGPMFRPNPSISFFVHCADAAEVDHLHAALIDGGFELMPLGSYPWSPRYAWVQDRYGVSWQLIAERHTQERHTQERHTQGDATVVPCLMFAGPQHGRAEVAMAAYTGVFAGSHVQSIERYVGDEGPEGTVKHGRFILAGHEFIAMDSHIDHGLTFGEGLSLQVICADQAELDRLWDALCEGGAPSRCGWLKDRFGLSWQLVPAPMPLWLGAPDPVVRTRVFTAMMAMNKLDFAELQRAFSGV